MPPSHDATPTGPLRAQSLGEEIANSVSHGVGFVASLVAAPFLLVAASRRGTADLVGAAVFVAAIATLYLSSTLYHALPRHRAPRAKRVFRFFDHGAIFLLIAGSYTPFTLGALRGPWGWTLLGLVWGLGIAGIVSQAVGGMRFPKLTTAMYIAMGWLIVVAVRPMWLRIPLPGLLWLLAGGLAYTAGVAFYGARRVRYAHFVWHLFVLAGTACHFVAVAGYAGGRPT